MHKQLNRICSRRKILLVGSTNPNVLLNAKLIDPNGVEIKRIEIPSNIDGNIQSR